MIIIKDILEFMVPDQVIRCNVFHNLQRKKTLPDDENIDLRRPPRKSLSPCVSMTTKCAFCL